MTVLAGFTESSIHLPQGSIHLHSAGKGRAFLFLHPGEGLLGALPFLRQLSTHGQILVPSHPGFGMSELPATLSTVDDLSYVYLDFLNQLALTDVTLIGASFGGWIAADIAIKNTQRISRLVLIDSLGIKVGDRDVRDITDMHALGRDALASHLYLNPTLHAPKFMKGEPDLAERYASDRESFTYFGWQPYMHDPKLRNRLHRIDVPTLVLWGEGDRIVKPEYGRAFASAIPGAHFKLILEAGHMAYVENPAEVATAVVEFAAQRQLKVLEANGEVQ
jgi:pimeloyl-ACP methyl ester carboxylesterase